MPSLKGYFSHLTLMLSCVRLGNSLVDRLKIIAYAFSNSVPRAVRNRSRVFERILSRFGGILKGVTVCFDGIKYILVDEESLFIFTPAFEPWMENYLKPEKGDIFLDVGAHIGKYTLQVAKTVGDEGLVIAVEPLPENFEILTQNIEVNSYRNIIPLGIAAWNKQSELRLYVGARHGYNTVKRDMGLGFFNVQGKKLDKALEELDIVRVDWIKIDVEGAEYEVFQGLEDTLKKNEQVKIIAEVSDANSLKVFDIVRQMGHQVFPIKGADGYYYFAKSSPPIA